MASIRTHNRADGSEYHTLMWREDRVNWREGECATCGKIKNRK